MCVCKDQRDKKKEKGEDENNLLHILTYSSPHALPPSHPPSLPPYLHVA